MVIVPSPVMDPAVSVDVASMVRLPALAMKPAVKVELLLMVVLPALVRLPLPGAGGEDCDCSAVHGESAALADCAAALDIQRAGDIDTAGVLDIEQRLLRLMLAQGDGTPFLDVHGAAAEHVEVRGLRRARHVQLAGFRAFLRDFTVFHGDDRSIDAAADIDVDHAVGIGVDLICRNLSVDVDYAALGFLSVAESEVVVFARQQVMAVTSPPTVRVAPFTTLLTP